MHEVYVSTNEAARRLGLCTKSVLAMLHAGELSGYAFTTAISGRVHAWKIADSSIQAYVARQQRRIPA